MKNFSERCKELRSSLQMSQQDFANLLRVSRNYVSMLESGREPGPKFLENFEAIEKQQQHRAAQGGKVVREGPASDDWMARALLAEEELAALRRKLSVFQKLLGHESTAKEAAEPSLPPRREFVYESPLKKAPRRKVVNKSCALSLNCPEACPILDTFDHRNTNP
jgi:transcriptional regulator with XRE-family HTH domain